MLDRLFNDDFMYKKGVISSNIYHNALERVLKNKVDAVWEYNYRDVSEKLESTLNEIDYVVLIYDEELDRDLQGISSLKRVLSKVLYEKVIIITNNNIINTADKLLGIGKNLVTIPYERGFEFKQVVNGLREAYKDEISFEEMLNIGESLRQIRLGGNTDTENEVEVEKEVEEVVEDEELGKLYRTIKVSEDYEGEERSDDVYGMLGIEREEFEPESVLDTVEESEDFEDLDEEIIYEEEEEEESTEYDYEYDYDYEYEVKNGYEYKYDSETGEYILVGEVEEVEELEEGTEREEESDELDSVIDLFEIEMEE